MKLTVQFIPVVRADLITVHDVLNDAGLLFILVDDGRTILDKLLVIVGA